MSFWKNLPKPIIGLSPMDGVTDHPFRHIQKKYGNPDVVYTEFTSVEGVCHGADVLLRDFLFDESQRPVVAQIYGTTPQFFRETATVLCELGFDGIDINMGCPAKNVAHSGAGAALINTPKLAQKIVRETKAGVQDFLNGKRAKDCEHISSEIAQQVEARHQLLPTKYQNPNHVPVSVKTRIGYDKKVAKDWVATLIEVEPEVISVHGRTLKQHYSGQADWEEIAKGEELTNQAGILYFGNGDVASYEDALQKVKTYGVDGALIGRASFGYPYVFLPKNIKPDSPTVFEIALEHARFYEQTFSHEERYNFLPMRKHLGWYIKGIPYATDIRIKIFKAENSHQVEEILKDHNLI